MSDLAALKELEEKLGYKFKKIDYLKRALTHSSYSGGKNNGSNERLEFLGDSVLQITVSLYLFTNMTGVPEGGLTKLRASIVCENSLYGFAKRIDLGKYILLGKGEEMTGGRDRRSILADAFEAVIAAIYLDGGMDEAQRMILSFVPGIEALKSGKVRLGDYKTILQEIIQQNPEEHISYEVRDDNAQQHIKMFYADVLLNGQVIGSGSGQSKKEAEQAAAKEAVKLMGYETD
ncbi:MAG: ribonuclease III [Oscillospiraceae bacterium]|nr:ribonuclease III [Oscillospiraceae bacterium]